MLLRTPEAEAMEARLFEERPCMHRISWMLKWRRFSAEALTDLADFPIRRYPHDFLLKRVWTLRNNFAAYEAVYVALAEALNARLLTRDRRLAAEVGRHVDIELA